jgi:hypothetical protein
LLRTGLFEATFSGVLNSWEVVTDSFRILVRNLHISKVDNLKTKWHKVKCKNCLFDLKDDWLIIESYDDVEVSSLW